MPRQPRLLPDASQDHAGERYAQALVAMTRRVWHPECQLDDAFAVISETAAETLHVQRSNIWRFDRERSVLVCLHAFDRTQGHAPPETLETLPVDGEYTAAMEQVRAIDAHDVTSSPATTDSGRALQNYLRRHRICSLLDAPVRVEGELVGVICHEQIDWPRHWTRDETAFAGSMGDFVAMAMEIARRRETEQALQHLRLHDVATGLPNAEYVAELLRDHIEHLRSDQRLVVLHLRIDTIRASALLPGAPTPDLLLHEMAARLRPLAEPPVALARVRPDALALITCFDADDEDYPVRLAERALALVRGALSAAEPASLAAFGIAFHEPGEDGPRALLHKAEQAAEQARTRGVDWEVFDLARHRALLARLHQERTLHDAFAQGRFEVHFQPERDLDAGRWRGAEALLRLREGGRLISAYEFIAVAEQAGLIVPLGRWVLEQACAAAAQWPDSVAHPTQVRVNVSARQFETGDLVADVAQALMRAGLAPGRLCLEITETTLMQDVPRALELLHRLKALGVQVAIDDFGTGYSSLVYLKRFPADILKIDRSFVDDLPSDPQDSAIVAAVVQLAQALGLDVIAEGVERPEQCAALCGIGVRHMQGWLFSAEVPAGDVVRLLR
jgi:EAL domain-containing protein (putative c-di-GMP-specific phosphodiesterase class I)